MTDYYALLGIEQKATKAEIKKNYRLLATKYHPDKNSDASAASIFIAITEAYDTLSNRKSRAQYDLQRWEALKDKQASKQSFATVVPQYESTRSRRNKAQQKRSTRYHQAQSKGKKTPLLILECFYILSRYVLYIMAITLIVVILPSVCLEIQPGFDTGIVTGLSICILVSVLVWGIIRLLQIIFIEFKKDIPLFSIYYKITQRKAMLFIFPVCILSLLIYLMILQAY